MALADDVNAWIADVAPWQLAKNDDTLDQVQPICTTAINAFRLLTLYLQPVMPTLAAKVEAFLNVDSQGYDTLHDTLLDHQIETFTPLLTRIELKDVKAMIRPDVTEIKEPAKTKVASDIEPIAPECTLDDFSKVDLRIATIVAAEAVKGADKLLQLTLDLGGETRQVFSGIKAAYQAEDLVGRQTVMIANLAPRKMKFGVSEGMVLAAGPGGSEIYLLEPDQGPERVNGFVKEEFMEHVTNAIVREAGSSKFYNAVEKKGHSFLMDEPELIGEEQLEPALLDPLTSALALGSGTKLTLQMYTDMKKLPLDTVNTEVTHTPSRERYHFQRVINLTGNLTSEQCQRLLEIKNKCPVHKPHATGTAMSSAVSGEAT